MDPLNQGVHPAELGKHRLGLQPPGLPRRAADAVPGPGGRWQTARSSESESKANSIRAGAEGYGSENETARNWAAGLSVLGFIYQGSMLGTFF